MRYVNNSGGIFLVPNENGKGGSIEVPKDGYFDGSSFYEKYAPFGLVRAAEGTPIIGSPGTPDPYIIPSANPLVFTLDKRLIPNSVHTNPLDVATYGVQNNSFYTAYGRITWKVGGTEFFSNFNIFGNGTHGSGATFAFSTPSGSPSTKPTVTGSSIDVRVGQFSIQFDSGAPDAESVKVQAHFDYEYSGEATHYGALGRSVTNFVKTRKRTVYVSASDVSGDATNYVSGSAGSVKQIREIPQGAKVGDTIKVTNFRYRDSSNATKATNEDVTTDVVIVDDLV